jgi:hypothetical protein
MRMAEAALDAINGPRGIRPTGLLRVGLACLASAVCAGMALPSVGEALPEPPPGRGYELVSHSDTHGMIPTVPLFFSSPGRQPRHPASPDGERLLFMTDGPVPGAQPATSSAIDYIATRSPSGWTQEYVGAPGDKVDASQLVAVASDLSTVLHLFASGSDAGYDLGSRYDPADLDETSDLYVRFPGGDHMLASPSPFIGDGIDFFDIASGGGTWTYRSTDASGFVTTPVYAWTPSGPEAVSVLPEGPISENIDLLQGLPLSADGERVAFVARAFDGAGPYRVWVRLRDEDRTVLASEPEGGISGADLDAELEELSDDGKTVWITSAQPLTSTDLDDQVDLYRFDIDAEALSLVSTAAPGAPSDGHGSGCVSTYGVSGCAVSPVAYSRDGATALFVSPEELADGAVAGSPNLYVNRAGQTTHVAVLSDADVSAASEVSMISNARYRRPIKLVDDGSRLVFESHAQLTGYDNGGVGEIYVYDVASGAFSCASCAGSSPLGPNSKAEFRTTDPFHVAQGSYRTQGRNITSDGSAVYFQTDERLVSKDVNGVADVYEYHVPSGSVTLISSGTGDDGSVYLDNSDDGEDVFFFSSDLLVSEEQDRNGNLWKIFDARRGGGFPLRGTTAPCGEADCRGPLASSPALEMPARPGGGNVASRRVRLKISLIRVRAGRLVVRVRRSRPGVVRVFATAPIGGRRVRIAARSRRVGRTGTARVVLRLSPRARDVLDDRSMRVVLHAKANGARPATSRVLLRETGR